MLCAGFRDRPFQDWSRDVAVVLLGQNRAGFRADGVSLMLGREDVNKRCRDVPWLGKVDSPSDTAVGGFRGLVEKHAPTLCTTG